MLDIQRRDVGAALALPSIASFCFAMLPVLVRGAQIAVLRSARNTQSSDLFARVYAKRIAQLPRKLFPISALLALIFMVSYFHSEELFYADKLSFEENLIRFPLAFQAWCMWCGLVLGMLTIFNGTRITIRYMNKHLRVDAFSATELFPIANTIYWNSLFFCMCIALTPLFWLGDAPSMKDFLLVMTILIILINLMFQPLFRAHQIIVERKRQAISALRSSALVSSSVAIDTRLYDSTSEDNVSARSLMRELVAAREWPLNIHLVVRFAAILLLPAITWLATNLIAWFLSL
jgi:hypothetical protein